MDDAATRRAGLQNEEAFTYYVREIEERGEPTRESFLQMWSALEKALIRELRRRSLWTAPPSYVGIFGWSSWHSQERGLGRTPEPLEDLLVDCYTHIFVRRLQRLRVRLAAGCNLTGIVLRYLRNFVHDRQRAHDRLGYRIFEVVHDAVDMAIEAGELFALENADKIRNDTLLAVSPQESTTVRVSADDLRPLIASWNDRLLPELVTAGGAGLPTRRAATIDPSVSLRED